jgi:hypothetical protein
MWLDFTRQPIAHLGGFVFGLVGGFLCGHKLQPRASRWRLLRQGETLVICVGLIGLTAWGVYNCSSKALEYYQHYAAIKDRERELQGQFHDVLLQWEQNKLTNAAFSQALQSRLIPALQAMRSVHELKLTSKLADMEKQSFSMQEFWKVRRSMRGVVKNRDQKSLTLKEHGELWGFLCKVRVDSWRALADELNGNDPFAARALLDIHELEMLASELDHSVNEDNPLSRWLESSRGRRQFDGELRPHAEEKTYGVRLTAYNGSTVVGTWEVSFPAATSAQVRVAIAEAQAIFGQFLNDRGIRWTRIVWDVAFSPDGRWPMLEKPRPSKGGPLELPGLQVAPR